MAVTMDRGLVDTADPVSNELKIDMREKIAMLDADTSQFSTMLMKLPQERARSFKVEWLNRLCILAVCRPYVAQAA